MILQVDSVDTRNFNILHTMSLLKGIDTFQISMFGDIGHFFQWLELPQDYPPWNQQNAKAEQKIGRIPKEISSSNHWFPTNSVCVCIYS